VNNQSKEGKVPLHLKTVIIIEIQQKTGKKSFRAKPNHSVVDLNNQKFTNQKTQNKIMKLDRNICNNISIRKRISKKLLLSRNNCLNSKALVKFSLHQPLTTEPRGF
jgi:hypothetical protein